MIERDREYELILGDSLTDELEKLSGISSIIRGALKKAPGAARGMSQANKGRLGGALIGSGIGAVGGAQADPEDRTGGALRGAILGGVGGLAAGQVATRAGRQQVKRFGQRQLHGMTGYVPRTAAQKASGIGWTGKGLGARERVKALEGIGMDVGEKYTNKAKAIRDAMGRQTVTKSLPESVRRRLAQAEVASRQAQREAVEQGLTSLPGVAKGMVRNPLRTLKTGFVSQGPAGMAMAAVPAAMAVPGVAKGEGEYGGQGGAGRFLGENIGYTALGAVPMAPMMAGAVLAGKAGELMHKGVQRKQPGQVVPPRGPYYYD